MKKQRMKGFNLLTLAQYNDLPEQDKKQYFNLVRGLDIYASKTDLQNYYTKSEIDQMINIGLKIEVVEELPIEYIRTDTIYLVPKTGEGNNNHYEYIYLESIQDWEKIGETDIDLTNYYTKTETDTKLTDYATIDYVDNSIGDIDLNDYYTKVEADNKLDEKLDKQQDIADAGKVLGIDEDGLVIPVEQSGGTTTLNGSTFGGYVEIDGYLGWYSLPPATRELDGSNIVDIDKNKYKNTHFIANADMSVFVKDVSEYRYDAPIEEDIPPQYTAYEYIFDVLANTEGAIMSLYSEIDPETGELILEYIIEDVAEVGQMMPFVYITIPNETISLTERWAVSFSEIDHQAQTITLSQFYSQNAGFIAVPTYLNAGKGKVITINENTSTGFQVLDTDLFSGGEDIELRNNSVNIANSEGGFAGGYNANATIGGAVGQLAESTFGGGAVGTEAKSTSGGAVGNNAKSESGGAVGERAESTFGGGAVGNNAKSTSGGAVGERAETSEGFAGGYNARTVDSNDEGINAIQLGEGTNSNPNTLQVYDYQLLDADGKIPAERLPESNIGVYALKERHKVTYTYSDVPGWQDQYEIIDGEFIGDGWVANLDLEVGKNYYQLIDTNAYNIFEIISNDTINEEIVVAREQWVKI